MNERGFKVMTKRNWLKTSLAVVMASALLVTACGNNGGNTTKSPANTGGSGEVSTEDVTYSYFSFASAKNVVASGTTIGKILKDQTGVDWKMEFAIGDVATK